MSKAIQRIDDLQPDVTNANKGTERGRYMVEASLRDVGAGRSIVVDKEGRVIAGNKTLEAWADVGGEIEVVRTDGKKLVVVQREDLDLSDDTGAARKLAYYDNRAGEVGLDWDAEQLLADLSAGVDLAAMFKDDELDALLAGLRDKPEVADAEAQIDKAEELRQKWQVETGQLWVIPSKNAKGEHRLLCGDCADPANLSILMNGQRAKLFATDPPYGVAYNDETGSGKGDTIANDENDGVKLQAFLENCFRAWLPHLDEHAAWYLWHAQLTQGFFAAAAAAAAADILIHRQIIWVKPSLILGHGDYHWRHELCFYGWRKGNRPAFYGERNQTTIWEVGRTNDTPHPTEKPPELWFAPMDNNTKRGEICAEPFCGSGSQYVAGEQKGRLIYGSDLEPKWVAVTLQRLADLGLEPRLDGGYAGSNA